MAQIIPINTAEDVDNNLHEKSAPSSTHGFLSNVNGDLYNWLLVLVYRRN